MSMVRLNDVSFRSKRWDGAPTKTIGSEGRPLPRTHYVSVDGGGYKLGRTSRDVSTLMAVSITLFQWPGFNILTALTYH